MKENKPSERQTGPQATEEDKPTLEDYKGEDRQEPDKRGMKPKEASNVED